MTHQKSLKRSFIWLTKWLLSEKPHKAGAGINTKEFNQGTKKKKKKEATTGNTFACT